MTCTIIVRKRKTYANLICMISDVLLCHDDELDNRAIAFVLYLVPPWNKKDGGALDLFDMDGKFFHHQFLS